MELEITKAGYQHAPELLQLYKKVAGASDGIIRKTNEINREYITELLTLSIENGLILIATIRGKIVGEIHAYTPKIHAFQHMLTDVTILVDPDSQGKGIGRKLFGSFLDKVTYDMPSIKRIELYTREHNERNVRFYTSLGFINEGRQKDKIFVTASLFETPLHMAWFNPNYGTQKGNNKNGSVYL